MQMLCLWGRLLEFGALFNKLYPSCTAWQLSAPKLSDSACQRGQKLADKEMLGKKRLLTRKFNEQSIRRAYTRPARDVYDGAAPWFLDVALMPRNIRPWFDHAVFQVAARHLEADRQKLHGHGTSDVYCRQLFF